MKKCFLILIIASIALVGCGEEEQTVTQARAVEVKVEHMVPMDVLVVKQYPADIIGKVYVHIRPQVTGYVDEIVTQEGSRVEKGDVIVKISEANYIQMVNSAKAAVGVAKATVENAKLNVEQTQSLYDNEIVSKFDLKNAENNLLSQQAQLSLAEAELERAEVNLGFTNVTSPTDGVIGTISTYMGTLVSPSDPKPITTVSNIDTMYVYFAMSEVDLLNITRSSDSKDIQSKFENPRLQLANGEQYELEGNLDMVSGLVERKTGTVAFRASFPNNGALRGGSNGYILLPIHMDSVMLVPQSMTSAMQDKISVYVVEDDGTVGTRFVDVMNETYEDSFVVTGGLEMGDKVIVQDAIKVRPGMKVAIAK